MHAVPVRGPDGLIASFVDPNAPVETEETSIEASPVEQDEEPNAPRPSRAISPQARTPLTELLGKKPASQPNANASSNRAFGTGLAAGLIAACTIGLLIVFTRPTANAPAALPTPAPAQPSANATSAPHVAVAAPTIGRALVAYAAPDGPVLGAISADRAITLTGVFGGDWIQIQTPDSATVWVKKVDLPSTVLDLAALTRLPNLAPPTATVAPTAVPAPTSMPVARPRTVPPASVDAPAPSVDGCTPDRVVAIVRKGAQQVSSCISLADAQTRLNGGTVVAADVEEVQAFNDRVREQSTALAQP